MWWLIGGALLAVALVYVLLQRENPRLRLDKQARNAPDIYDQPADGRVFVPFSIEIDPMKHMLIMDFAGHPVYQAMELQRFDHPDKGTGANFLLSRVGDNRADFYFEPTVKMHRERMSVGAGVGEWVETPLDYHFEITPAGLDAEIRLTDTEGRDIHLRIKENRRDRRPPLTLLAPMGAGIKAPIFLPFFHLRRIDLVRQAGTEFTLTIDGQSYLPDKLPPVPHNLAGTYFARYCADPLIAMINRAADRPLTPLETCRGSSYQEGDTRLTFSDNEGHCELQQIAQQGDGHTVHMTFAPPMPDLAKLRPGIVVNGRFAIGSDDIHSVIVGDYSVRREGERVRLMMQPTEDWWPRTGGLRAKGTLAFFPPAFRQWMQHYRWTAELTPDDGAMHLSSRWERLGGA